MNITKLTIIYCKKQFIVRLKAGLINFEIINLKMYHDNEEIIKKCVPQYAEISQLELFSSTFPSQLDLGREQLYWGTAAREVLFHGQYMHGIFYQPMGRPGYIFDDSRLFKLQISQLIFNQFLFIFTICIRIDFIKCFCE